MKLGFVVPWYGPQATGGAETAVRRTAEALYHRAGLDVEVLTTCSREFGADWSVNELPPGLTAVNGVPVRRFPVRPRDTAGFDRVNARLMRGASISAEDEATFIREMIHSDALDDFIRAGAGDWFWIFTPYMFGTTHAGVAIHPERSALIPALHDESYAYLGIYVEMFRRVRGVIFYSRAEMELARQLYSLRIGTTALIPGGLDPAPPGDGARFRARHGIREYLLYVGRKEEGKNLPWLLDAFARYRGGDLRLVLLGKGPVTAPPGLAGRVLDLGFVPEEDKRDAYAGALALCQPSVNESFSLVMMEAWLQGTPCLVHADCAVTREHCLDSDGGLFVADAREFAAAVDVLRASPEQRATLGRQGQAYVLRQFGWDNVIARYLDALRRWGVDPATLRRPGATAATEAPPRRAGAIHQILTGFREGDAISNHALTLRDVFRSWGVESEIFAADLGPEGEAVCRRLPALAGATRPHDVLVYHHSIHSEAAKAYVQTAARRVLIYHNITPSAYFSGVSRRHPIMTELGRTWLPDLVRVSRRLLADSTFNASELRAAGAGSVQVLPILVDFRRLDALEPDPAVLARLGDDRVNLLFVGRVVRNKRQADVIEAYRAYRRLNPWSRLLLVGPHDDDGGVYVEELRDLLRQAQLPDVALPGRVSDRELAAYYRSAHVFVCMSEHEGFCVPVVEAMHRGIPVVAYAAAAVPETLGDAGVLVQEKDYPAIARHIDRLVRDQQWRAEIVAGQRRRLKDFAPETIAATLRLQLEDLLCGSGDGP